MGLAMFLELKEREGAADAAEHDRHVSGGG